MIDSNFDAIFVKVAGAGLEPHKHLNKSISQLYPTLLRLNERFGLDMCGEGGEYETIVLDCPLFKKRIVIDECSITIDPENDSVGYLKVSKVHLENKGNDGAATTTLPEQGDHLSQIDLTPSILTISRDTLHESTSYLAEQAELTSKSIVETMGLNLTDQHFALRAPMTVSMYDGYGFTGLCYPPQCATSFSKWQRRSNRKDDNSTTAPRSDESTVAQIFKTPNKLVRLQLYLILDDIRKQLHQLKRQVTPSLPPGSHPTDRTREDSHGLEDVLYVHLYLSDMNLFADVNQEYGIWFQGHLPLPLPPSRSTVAV